MLFQCIKPAEWHLHNKQIYHDTYSCTEHLSEMVSDDTVTIYEYPDDAVFGEDAKCCYLGPEDSVSESAPWIDMEE